MPQVARHGAHVAAAGDHHGCEGVAQVVEGALEAVHLAEGREVLAELGWVVGPAVGFLGPEDVGVAEGHAHLAGPLGRGAPERRQPGVGVLGQRDGPLAAGGLGRLDVEPALSAAQRAPDRYGAVIVKVRPPERADLAAAHARGECELDGQRERGAERLPCVAQHAGALRAVEGVYGGLHALGGLQKSQGFLVSRSMAMAYFSACLSSRNGFATLLGA